ncbi:hypothetical protein OUZ56_016348 [Daphnia magna]|uniref:Uncharacterized protein n=1 Tax=Daphnia magna TaxID=35525 RepID=A0ABR0AQE3_9CRUS|nr:hypothetical protein OUZ56_016348 [Daphnia magna]
MDRSYQDISIPIIVKTFGLIVFPIVPKSGVETVFLQPAPTQLPMRSSKTSCVARFSQMRKSHLCPSWSAAAAASYGETIFFACSSLLAEEFRLLPEIRLLQGDEQQTIHKQ